MIRNLACALRLSVALMLALVVTAPGLGLAQQAVNPTAEAVQEQELLDALGSGQTLSGRVSIPNQRAADLIKPEGRDWTAFHNQTQRAIAIWSLVGTLVVLALFYLVRGRIRVEQGFSGRTIKRFGWVERFGHWLTASCFIVLALTGLNLVIGRYILVPLVGPEGFGTVTAAGKVAHNFLAWPFMLGLVLIFLFWVKDNLPSKVDGKWLAQGGGMFRKGVHPPARKFNAGQKLIFWTVIIGGALLSWTGWNLIFPADVATSAQWQQAQMLHGIGSAVMIAVILAHIYIGSLGMEGAFDAMASGDVDVNWAREHHALWVEEKLGAAADRPVNLKGGIAPAE